MYFIYLVTNLINNKKYVGLTTKTIEHRWKEHINCSHSNGNASEFALHRAIAKYGEQNFIVEQIDTADSENELKQKEIYYIAYFHTYTNDPCGYGYNMTPGGDLNTHLKGELSPCSKNSNDIRYKIIDLLKTTTMKMKDIAIYVGLNSNDGEKLVSMINNGDVFYQDNENYPIRQRSQTIRGENNPAAKTEAIIKVIDLLINSDLSQTEIAKQCGVHYNTVNDINRCKRWTHLHSYKTNIRKERKTNGNK